MEDFMSFEFIFDALKRENQTKIDDVNFQIAQLERYIQMLKQQIAMLKALIEAMKQAQQALMAVA